MRRAQAAAAAVAAAVLFAAAPAPAQDYPTRSITLVVPFPAGGGNDALARIVAEKMSKSLGQQVVVENRGGAGGTIATRAVAKSAPDGYTLVLSYTGTFAINPTLYPNAGYDPRKDFAPIGPIASLPSILVVHPSVPVRSTTELISYAKANPGKVNYAFVPGTVGHISTEMFARTAGIALTNVPYKGNGNAIADLLGGHVQMMFLSVLPVAGNVRNGTLRGLAVTSAARSRLVPDVPAISEAGLPGFSADIYYGLAAPAGTPRSIIQRLNGDLRLAVAADDANHRLVSQGAVPLSSTPEEYAADIDADEKKWSALVKSLNLKFE